MMEFHFTGETITFWMKPKHVATFSMKPIRNQIDQTLDRIYIKCGIHEIK